MLSKLMASACVVTAYCTQIRQDSNDEIYKLRQLKKGAIPEPAIYNTTMVYARELIVDLFVEFRDMENQCTELYLIYNPSMTVFHKINHIVKMNLELCTHKNYFKDVRKTFVL